MVRTSLLSESPHSSAKKHARQYGWIIMASVCTAYSASMLQRNSFPYAAPSMLSEGILTAYWQVGLVSATMVYLGYAPFQILAGILADKAGAKRLVYGSIVVSSTLSYLTGLTHDFFQASVVRLALGVSQMGSWVPPMRILSRWFGVRRRTFAFSLLSSSGYLPTVAMGFLMPYLVTQFGWQVVFYVPAAVGFVAAPIVYLYLKDEPSEVQGAVVIGGATEEKKGSKIPLSAALRNRYVLLLTIGLTLASALYQGLTYYGYPYLVGLLSPLEAGIATSLLAVGRLIGTPIGGILADRVGRGPLLVVTSLIMIPLIYAFSTFSSETSFLILPFVVVFGFVFSAQLPCLMAFALEVSPSQLAGTVIGIVNLGASVGIFAFAPVFGIIIDMSGGLFFPAWMFGLSCYVGAAVCYAYVYISRRGLAAVQA